MTRPHLSYCYASSRGAGRRAEPHGSRRIRILQIRSCHRKIARRSLSRSRARPAAPAQSADRRLEILRTSARDAHIHFDALTFSKAARPASRRSASGSTTMPARCAAGRNFSAIIVEYGFCKYGRGAVIQAFNLQQIAVAKHGLQQRHIGVNCDYQRLQWRLSKLNYSLFWQAAQKMKRSFRVILGC